VINESAYFGASPRPAVGQVWVTFKDEEAFDSLITYVIHEEEGPVYRLSSHTEGIPLEYEWPPRGAILVAGPGSPWLLSDPIMGTLSANSRQPFGPEVSGTEEAGYLQLQADPETASFFSTPKSKGPISLSAQKRLAMRLYKAYSSEDSAPWAMLPDDTQRRWSQVADYVRTTISKGRNGE
jgi:hypothetical protein